MAFIQFLIALLILYGYFANIVKLFFTTGFGEALLRFAGIAFPPLGILLGFI